MTTLATLIIVAALGYLVYRAIPRGAERAFRLERFHPHSPMSDWTSSYYDEQRRYADLAAIYGRGDVPEAEPAVIREPETAQPEAIPAAPALAEPTGQPAGTPDHYAWRSRRTVAPGRTAPRRPARGVRRLVTDPSTLDSKAS
ncbi:hypothetical protein ACFYO1_22325 [Nocardia sp. NPDC006044]|uniref:hypothetical protein n=1 Tax=Nocardia sp. NPDC006044 TaxID=3364306 RepID=UPI0036A90E0F